MAKSAFEKKFLKLARREMAAYYLEQGRSDGMAGEHLLAAAALLSAQAGVFIGMVCPDDLPTREDALMVAFDLMEANAVEAAGHVMDGGRAR